MRVPLTFAVFALCMLAVSATVPRLSREEVVRMFESKRGKNTSNDWQLFEFALVFNNSLSPSPTKGSYHNYGVSGTQALVTWANSGDDSDALGFTVTSIDDDARIVWDSTLTPGTSSFADTGVLEFGDSSITFTGSTGQFIPAPVAGYETGGAVSVITGGAGQFEGATGVLIDSFINTGAPFFTVNAWGFFWVPQ